MVLLRRGDPRNSDIEKRLPSKHEGLDVTVEYTSTRPQIRKDDKLHAVISRSSRGRSTNFNRGTVGFIAEDFSWFFFSFFFFSSGPRLGNLRISSKV